MQKTKKITFTKDDLKNIARELLENPDSAHYSTGRKIGKNTMVYSSYDYAASGNSTITQRNDSERNSNMYSGEIYIVIRRGVELNGNRYKSTIIDSVPLVTLTKGLPDTLAEILKKIYGYNIPQSDEIYKHIVGIE